MPHELERPFHDRVTEYLREHYGDENVEQNKYLADPYRFVDIWVDGPLVDYAIEVEDTFDGVIRGVGQAQIYSYEGKDAVPVVVVPPDHVEHPEVDALRERIEVIELDV